VNAGASNAGTMTVSREHLPDFLAADLVYATVDADTPLLNPVPLAPSVFCRQDRIVGRRAARSQGRLSFSRLVSDGRFRLRWRQSTYSVGTLQ
jgi:hypothetical protein